MTSNNSNKNVQLGNLYNMSYNRNLFFIFSLLSFINIIALYALATDAVYLNNSVCLSELSSINNKVYSVSF